MRIILTIDLILWIIISLLYSYQFYYLFYMIFNGSKKDKVFEVKKLNKIAVVIPARNEENVIGHLIESIKNQNYDKDLLEIYVIADNCDDKTKEVSQSLGAKVFERFNKVNVGKGFALNYFFNKILKEENDIDAFVVLDADNLLDENFIYEMNRVYSNGYDVLTSYRNSKNYDTNWISAGYSLWFLREAKFLNNPRMNLNTGCAISGTGFLVDKKLIEKNNNWDFFLLTEDIQFSIKNALDGVKIGYAKDAELFDEQPTTFKQSYKQRLRWAKGFYQVFFKYHKNLIKEITTLKSFAVYDMFVTVFPAIFLTIIDFILYTTIFFYSLLVKKDGLLLFTSIIKIPLINMGLFYLLLYSIGVVTLVSEWKKIHAKTYKKILYTFTFPIFLLSYIPISIIAIFKKVKWVPIEHNVEINMEQINKKRKS